MNNERYYMQYMCGPVCKKRFHGSVTSHVTHMYEHLVGLNKSVWLLCLTNAAFGRDIIWICRMVRDCQLLIDCVRTLLMTSSCVNGFSRNCLLSVSFPWGWHLQIGDARRGVLYWCILSSCVGFDKYSVFNEFWMLIALLLRMFQSGSHAADMSQFVRSVIQYFKFPGHPDVDFALHLRRFRKIGGKKSNFVVYFHLVIEAWI